MYELLTISKEEKSLILREASPTPLSGLQTEKSIASIVQTPLSWFLSQQKEDQISLLIRKDGKISWEPSGCEDTHAYSML